MRPEPDLRFRTLERPCAGPGPGGSGRRLPALAQPGAGDPRALQIPRCPYAPDAGTGPRQPGGPAPFGLPVHRLRRPGLPRPAARMRRSAAGPLPAEHFGPDGDLPAGPSRRRHRRHPGHQSLRDRMVPADRHDPRPDARKAADRQRLGHRHGRNRPPDCPGTGTSHGRGHGHRHRRCLSFPARRPGRPDGADPRLRTGDGLSARYGATGRPFPPPQPDHRRALPGRHPRRIEGPRRRDDDRPAGSVLRPGCPRPARPCGRSPVPGMQPAAPGETGGAGHRPGHPSGAVGAGCGAPAETAGPFGRDPCLELAACIRERRGIGLDALCRETGRTYGEVAADTGILAADGFICMDLLQNCTIKPKNM